MTGPESADVRQHLHGWPIRDYDHLIATLARSRASQDITYAEMARRMGGCYLQQVFNWLNGVEPRAHRAFDLAHALGYDLALVPREDS